MRQRIRIVQLSGLDDCLIENDALCIGMWLEVKVSFDLGLFMEILGIFFVEFLGHRNGTRAEDESAKSEELEM